MTVDEATKIMQDFNYQKNVPTEEEFFMYTEAMDFLISETHNPHYMLNLGGVYYELKRFDLALKYYEMAASYDLDDAYECLAYIWYYGRTGTKDYKKAFEYFSKLMDKGDIVSAYKVADMYKNGYYVEKNQKKYAEMIEGLYDRVKDCKKVYEPLPEVFTRLACIRKEQGRYDEAVNLYLEAKDFLAQRIKWNAFWGNLNIMKWLIDDLYELIEFDPDFFDFYDLYYLLKSPHKILFEYKDCLCSLESVQEGAECAVNFNGKWFHDRDDFFNKAVIGDIRLPAVYDEFYGFEVIN